MNRYVRGVIGGGAGTLVMTGAILAGERLFRFRTPPPKEITRNVLWRIGMPRAQSGALARVIWVAAHEAYGMTCGVGYALVRPRLPASRYAAGLIFGGAVWVVGYLGYLPALGLYPSPDDDKRSRTSVMVIAHAVFGVVLAEVEHRLSRRDGHR